MLGSVRYDLAVNQFDQTRFGIGYTDDCLLISLNYLTSYTYTGNDTDAEQHVHAAVEPADAWTRLPGSDRFLDSKFVHTKVISDFPEGSGELRKGRRTIRRRSNTK